MKTLLSRAGLHPTTKNHLRPFVNSGKVFGTGRGLTSIEQPKPGNNTCQQSRNSLGMTSHHKSSRSKLRSSVAKLLGLMVGVVTN